MEVESNPRCCCGAQTKAYSKPVLKELDKRPDLFADVPKIGK
jgi:hypothetical protein